jgi:hypothetical protein
MKGVIDAIQAKEREVEFRAEPIEKVQFSDGWLTINGERFFVTETARRMLAEGLGMPAAFVLQLPLQLQVSLFNFVINRTVARAPNKPPVVRFAVRGDMVVAAAINPKSLTTSLSSALTKIFEVIPEEWTEMEPMVHRWCWSPQKAEVQLIFQQVSSEPRPGDIVSGGIWIRVSPIGLRAPSVEPFLLRLICANGMVVPERLCTKTNGDRRKNGSDFLQSAERAWRTLSEVMRRLLDLAQERVDVEAEVVTIARDLRLSTALRRALLNALERDELGNHGTLLDVINAVSRVATHHDRLNDAVRHRLMRAAGLILQGEHRCPTCRRIWLRPVGDEV